MLVGAQIHIIKTFTAFTGLSPKLCEGRRWKIFKKKNHHYHLLPLLHHHNHTWQRSHLRSLFWSHKDFEIYFLPQPRWGSVTTSRFAEETETEVKFLSKVTVVMRCMKGRSLGHPGPPNSKPLLPEIPRAQGSLGCLLFRTSEAGECHIKAQKQN